MTSIYLIRHAEAEGNLYRIAQGQYNSNLTDRGWRQVRALEARFEKIPIDAVYASDLYRTCATASAIYQPKGLTLHRRKDLREICVGEWEQQTWGEIYRRDPVQMDNFSRHIDRWYIPGAERPEQVLRRVMGAVRAIAREQEGRRVAVFSHGYAIRLLLATLQGYPLERVGETSHGDNTAVSLLEADGETLRVVFRDDNSHLQTPEFLAGEKNRKRATALQPGLWFAPLRAEEQAWFLERCAEQAWVDSGWNIPFEKARFLEDTRERTTLVGYLGETPSGLVQLGPEPGEIALAYIEKAYRNRGFGVQLIGQAVQHARAAGGEKLRVVLAENSPAAGFFRDYGFSLAGKTPEGGRVLEKDLRFRREFLGE